VAAIQAYPLAFDLQDRRNGANVPHALELLEKAAGLGANLACFHELYPLVGEAELCHKARELGIHVVAGLAEPAPNGWYNTATVISPQGTVLGRQRKKYPTALELDNGVIPGDSYQVVETEVGRLGMIICADFAFFTDGVEGLVAQKADIIFNPALWFALSEAFPPTVIGRHMEYSVPMVGVNIAREPYAGAQLSRKNWLFPPAGGYTTICVPPKVKVLDDLGQWFRTKPGGIDSLQGFVQIMGTEEGIITAEIDLEAVRAFPGYFYRDRQK
jgi:predicted amidohydrolase